MRVPRARTTRGVHGRLSEDAAPAKLGCTARHIEVIGNAVLKHIHGHRIGGGDDQSRGIVAGELSVSVKYRGIGHLVEALRQGKLERRVACDVVEGL